jgi:hypothetical protein
VKILVSNPAITKFEIFLAEELAPEISISHENSVRLKLYISIHSLLQSKKISEIINSGFIVEAFTVVGIGAISLVGLILFSSFSKISLTCHDCHSTNTKPLLIPMFSSLTPVLKIESINCPVCQSSCQPSVIIVPVFCSTTGVSVSIST